jgi:uncharacterized membrane protein
VLSVVLFMLATYIRWTSSSLRGGIGAAVVGGVQGRYFIPLLVFAGAALGWAPARLRARAARFLSPMLEIQITVMAAFLVLTWIAIALRFYVPGVPS